MAHDLCTCFGAAAGVVLSGNENGFLSDSVKADVSMFALFFARRWSLTIDVLIAVMAHTTFVVPLMIFLFLPLKKFDQNKRSYTYLYLRFPAIFCPSFWVRASMNLQVAADCEKGLRQKISKKFFHPLMKSI